MAVKFKLENGVQLLSRLQKKNSLENFYPTLFKDGLKNEEIIEIFNDNSPNFFINELVTETLIPQEIGGLGTGTLMFITDGNFESKNFIELLKNKIIQYSSNKKYSECYNNKIDVMLEMALKDFHMICVYDANQLYTTIQNLDNILSKHPNISLIVFNTLTAFYWSEQNYKVSKMDWYLKNLIRTIQKSIKNFKVSVMYARPQYFSSSKEVMAKLEPCCCHPTDERVNYRIQIIKENGGINYVVIQSHDQSMKKAFNLIDGFICWKQDC